MTTDIKTERSLQKVIAGASRPLDQDLNMSRLQAIDRLQKTHEKFRDQWIGASPALVLEDGWMMPNNAAVERMLAAMDKHGDPVGMVGIAWLTHARKYAVLKMAFCSKDNAKARRAMDHAAQEAHVWFAEEVRKLGPMKKPE